MAIMADSMIKKESYINILRNIISADPAIIDLVAKFPLFAGVNPYTIGKLCTGGYVVNVAHREVLFHYGARADVFAIILSGAFKFSRLNPLGEDTILYFGSPGDVLGALVLAHPKPAYPATISAIGDASVLIINKDVYLTSWIENPQLVKKMQESFLRRMTILHHHKVMQRTFLPSKIASCLLQYAVKDVLLNSLSIPIPLTRREIAETVGSTVESTIRVMSAWEKQGVVQTTESSVVILRPEILIQLANDPVD